jgi:hypothetical protein
MVRRFCQATTLRPVVCKKVEAAKLIAKHVRYVARSVPCPRHIPRRSSDVASPFEIIVYDLVKS